MGIKEDKARIRERIWELLEERGVATFPLPIKGRIPNFKGNREAAENLRRVPEFKRAEVVKCNPDSPQASVRELAMREGKTLLVPTPRLRGEFFLFLGKSIENPREASRIRNFSVYGRRVGLEEIPQVDLVVVGSVAVSREGERVGKGEGYSELEYAILREVGKVSEDVPVVTTVHSLQVVDEIPWEPFDVPLDLIVTEENVFKTERKRAKPRGLLLEFLSRKKIDDTPFLREYLRKTGRLSSF